MTDHFEKNARSWGPEGVEWLARIPQIIEKYEAKWSFRALPPFELNYNYVAPAIRADGAQAVLKIGFPKDTEFKSEINTLEFFGGEGICRLVEADAAHAIMLIERILPGKPVADIDDDDEATRVIASTMKRLHKVLPPNHEFTGIKDLVTAIPEYRRKYQGSGPIPNGLVDKAEELFTHLIATSQAPVLTHGDLHHHNVLNSEAHGWVAIDPKGVAAEPAYDAAAMLRNPYDKLKTVTNLRPILARRIAVLSEELHIDRERIRQWGFAHMVLSAIWSAEGVKGPEHALRVARVLV